MEHSFSKSYLKIYCFQILSIILGFASFLVVIPFISSEKSLYGIYSVCVSVSIFLSYADLGFLGASMKYAAESYSKGNLEEELELIGFSHFILLIFTLLFSFVFLYLSINPGILISDLNTQVKINVASKLLIILAIFTPVTVLQRILQIIFGIRLKDFRLQKINIIGNFFKIISVFYFFNFENYNIVGYFLFIQIVNLICVILGVIKAKKDFNYNFIKLIGYLRFSRKLYHKTNKLAYSGLVVTISWIIYYEMDSFFIGKFLGPKEVAIYAIGFTILSFFRSVLGVFFSPFLHRFNHFIGLDQIKELKSFYVHIMTISFPIVVFPILVIIFFSKSIVISWVGFEYEQSISIVQWLIACNILGFISYPAGMLMVANEKIKQMYFISILMPLIYWIGIYLTSNIFGILSFAIFKFIAFLLSAIFYFFYTLKFLEVSFLKFFKEQIMVYLPALFFLIVFSYYLSDLFIGDRNRLYLLINSLIVGTIIILAIVISLFYVKSLKNYIFKLLGLFLKSGV